MSNYSAVTAVSCEKLTWGKIIDANTALKRNVQYLGIEYWQCGVSAENSTAQTMVCLLSSTVRVSCDFVYVKIRQTREKGFKKKVMS